MANDHKLNLEENSKYRVAYDLMETVAFKEKRSFESVEDARKYYFDLYQQSFRVVYHNEDYDKVVSKQSGKRSENQHFTTQASSW